MKLLRICKKSQEFSFSFSQAVEKRYIKGDSEPKTTPELDISSRIVKQNPHIYGDLLLYSFNDASENLYFATALKQANENRKLKANNENVLNMQFFEEILFGVLQELVLGSLFFNIFMCDLFFTMIDPVLTYYLDDDIPFVTGKSTEDIIKLLKNGYIQIIQLVC